MSCEAMDVVVVPFPFVDGPAAKRRPALVLSQAENFGGPCGHSVMAMITSARNRPWPLDVAISDLEEAGLPAASVVRMKLFTLDHRPVLRTSGWISIGLGAVALGVGTVYGFQVEGWESDQRAATTAKEKARLRDEGEFAEDMATGMLVAGGILAAGGALLLWLGAEDEQQPQGGLSVGPGQVSWSWTW